MLVAKGKTNQRGENVRMPSDRVKGLSWKNASQESNKKEVVQPIVNG